MSGALQAFIIELELEGGKAVVKGLKEVDAAADKTEKSLKDIAKTETQADKGLRGFITSARTAAPVLIGLAAAGAVLKAAMFTINYAKQAEDLLFMANSAGIAADKMQRLALAGEKAGGTRQGAAATAGNITRQLQAIRYGEDAPLIEAAKKYDQTILQGRNGQLATTEEVLENIARAFEHLDLPAQIDMASIIGIDDGTFRNLQKGLAGYRASLREAGTNSIFPPGSEEEIKAFQNQLRDLQQQFGKIGAKLALELLPYVSQFIKRIENLGDVINENWGFISGFFERIALFITWLSEQNPLKTAYKGVQSVYENITTPFYEKLWKNIKKGAEIVYQAEQSPLNSISRETIANTTNNTTNSPTYVNMPVTVNGAQQPAQVADELAQKTDGFIPWTGER